MELIEISTPAEKCRRLNEAILDLKKRYTKLVWFDGTDPQKLIDEGWPELLDVYYSVSETRSESGIDWEYGFDCGMLAAVEYLAVFVGNFITRDDSGVIDGRLMAESLFPDMKVTNEQISKEYLKSQPVKMSITEDGKLLIDPVKEDDGKPEQ